MTKKQPLLNTTPTAGSLQEIYITVDLQFHYACLGTKTVMTPNNSTQRENRS